MKKIFVLLALFVLGSSAFSEIVDWKGMDHGIGARPKWFFKYVKSKNEKQIRKRLDVDPSSSLVLGVGTADALETARSASQINAQEKCLAQGNVNLLPLYEYWEEDDEKGFTVYSLYENKSPR